MARLVRFLSILGTFLLLLCTPSCLRVLWTRAEFLQPIEESQHQDLCAPEASLTACLERLGAPLYVWEEADEQIALAWGWNEESDWGINLSIPLAQEFSATLDYQNTDLDLYGLVLVFDGSDHLAEKRLGLLSDMGFKPRRRRPDAVETAAVEGGTGKDE